MEEDNENYSPTVMFRGMFMFIKFIIFYISVYPAKKTYNK